MDREGAGEHGLLGDGSGPEGACAGQVCPAPSGMGLSGGSRATCYLGGLTFTLGPQSGQLGFSLAPSGWKAGACLRQGGGWLCGAWCRLGGVSHGDGWEGPCHRSGGILHKA